MTPGGGSLWHIRREAQLLEDFSPPTAEFLDEVLRGLNARPKRLPSKYFYDDRGCELFEQICELDEYYLTRTELAIMRRHGGEMATALGPDCMLIELGSGSGVKTRILLEQLAKPVTYVPIDIALDHLRSTADAIKQRFADVRVLPICADFSQPVAVPDSAAATGRKVVYFPGSTIGNFDPHESFELLHNVARIAGPGGNLLIGVDLQKDAATLEAAYDDSRGVTAQFNLNLLARINRELGGDFQLAQFEHRAFYNANAGRIEMHLVSTTAQVVNLAGQSFAFASGETICSEYSYKYDLDAFRALAARGGWKHQTTWLDDGRLFAVILFFLP